MKRISVNIFAALVLALTLAACQTVPYTGRSQFLMTSKAQEDKLGEDAWREVCAKEKKCTNQQYNEALLRVGTSIAQISGQSDFKWEFRVFQSKEANAFCLPGGKVAVYSELFKLAANDAELASVVGHEIGHAIARHGGERMSQAAVQSAGLQVVSAATKGNTAWTQAYGIATEVGGMLPYSRLHEYEADYIGLILMAKAGYDPNAAISFWNKFKTVGSSGPFGEFFSTHPMSEKRIEEMRLKMPEAIDIYNKCPNKKGLGVKYR